MQGVHIIIENGTEQHLWCAMDTPGKIALQREPHSPGIEPVGEFTVTNGLADKMIDRVFKRDDIIFQSTEHKAHRRESQYTAKGDKKIRSQDLSQSRRF